MREGDDHEDDHVSTNGVGFPVFLCLDLDACYRGRRPARPGMVWAARSFTCMELAAQSRPPISTLATRTAKACRQSARARSWDTSPRLRCDHSSTVWLVQGLPGCPRWDASATILNKRPQLSGEIDAAAVVGAGPSSATAQTSRAEQTIKGYDLMGQSNPGSTRCWRPGKIEEINTGGTGWPSKERDRINRHEADAFERCGCGPLVSERCNYLQ